MMPRKSANQIKQEQKERIRQGNVLGHIDPDMVRRCYIDEAMPVSGLAARLGISVSYLRLYCQAMEISRDRGHMIRSGTQINNRGVRKPGSIRDLASKKPRAGSPECREKMAAAKRGKTGALSNRWKGGHEIGGYEAAGSGSTKTYRHRVVAEEVLGRPLETDEQVHHKDCNRKNNERENLIVLGIADHSRLHVAMRMNAGLDQIAWLKSNDIPFLELT